jgi:gluconolactonase
MVTSKVLFAVGLAVSGATAVMAQGQTTPDNLQAPSDPRYAAVVAKCRTPPAAPPAGAAPGRAGGTPPAAGPAEYTITGIPEVVASDARWTKVWETTGNNADGILADEDGGLLLAQNDNGVVVKLDAKSHQPSAAYRDTNTGGALSRSPKGALFVASRGIDTAILQLAPQRRVFANRYQGEPLECIGGVLNDVTADSRGGVYFTMGGLFYADAKGVVTSYGKDLRTNGVILSPDEKALYVTNGPEVVAFEVRPDGALANQRTFAKLPAGGADGLAVDAAGRLYVTAGGGGGGAPGVHVFAPDGKVLGTIAGPRNFITAAFAGPDKKTLYAVANDRRVVEVYSLPMLAQGFRGRAK